jgi:hypothetical protein
MDIEVCAQWDRMSMQEAAAQLGGKFNIEYGISGAGNVGYLREPYHGEPYATKILVPEAFETGRASISAAALEARLPAVLEAAERREREVYDETDAEAIERVLKSYRDFVALCGRMERETGTPCTIIASY